MFKKAKLLIAAASVSVCALAAAPASAAFFSGFEGDAGLSNGQWTVMSPSFDGWNVISGPGIEVQNGNVGGTTAYEGNQKVELDSHGGQNTNSRMEQTVSLSAGRYQFSFAYFGRTGDTGTNGIGYSLAPGVLDVSNVTGVKAAGWTIISHMFTLNADTDVTMAFWADGKDDTLGGYLDNVRISAVPLPPAVMLFGAALAGLGWLGRRRKGSALTS
ncbi:MAG: hypothetical protein ABJP25_16450 [Sneathiella sp.]